MNFRQVMGVAGDVFAGLRFVLPIVTFCDICKTKEVGQRSVIPYGVTWCNCLAWMLYALPMSSWLVAGVNLAGLVIVPAYVFLYFYHSAGQARFTSWVVLVTQGGWAVLLVIVHFGFFNGRHHEDAREMTFGVLGAVTASGMYLASLIDTHTVYTTKNVKHMSILFVLASCCNCISWVLYASVNLDYYILVPNGLGVLVTVGQFVVWVMYWKATPAEAQPAQAQPA